MCQTTSVHHASLKTTLFVSLWLSLLLLQTAWAQRAEFNNARASFAPAQLRHRQPSQRQPGAINDAKAVVRQAQTANVIGFPIRPTPWAPVAGPETGLVLSIAVKDGRVFAGTTGGVYLSDDDGQTWRRSVTGPPTQVYSLRVSGDAIFFGTDAFGLFSDSNGGVRRSTDNGETWQDASSGLPDRTGVGSLAEHQGQLFATTFDSRVFRSADQGESWTLASNGLPDGRHGGLLASTPSALLAWFDQGLFLTTDAGEHWVSVNERLPAGIALTPWQIPQAMGESFFVPTLNAGVIASHDSGQSWEFSNQGLPERATVGSVNQAGGELYCAVASGELYHSADQGESWAICNDSFALGKSFRGIVRSNETLLVATFDGLVRSADDGVSWERSNTGLLAASLDGGMLVFGNTLYVATQGGIWATNTKGASWRQLNEGMRQQPFTSLWGSALGSKDGLLFAGSYGDGLYRSDNGGNTWERLSNGLPEVASPAVIRVLSGRLYAGYWDGGAYVSDDNGDTWQASTLPAAAPFLTFAELGGGRLLAGSYGGGMFRSDDNGATWHAFKDGIRNDFIDDINVYRNTILAATDDGVYRMNEDESGWSELTGYAEAIAGGANALIRVGKTLYATTYGRGLAASNNNGESWYSVNQGMTTNRSFYFALLDNDLFVGTAGGGVFVLRNAGR